MEGRGDGHLDAWNVYGPNNAWHALWAWAAADWTSADGWSRANNTLHKQAMLWGEVRGWAGMAVG